MPEPRDPLLQEREKTHGNFRTTATIAQDIKSLFRAMMPVGSEEQLVNVQKEALDLIATKIARILSGHPKTKDHWLDIAGYAKLGAEACD